MSSREGCMRMESRNQEAPRDDQNQYEHDFDENLLGI